MDIIGRIDEAATILRTSAGVRARYLYLGESEIRELYEYIEKNGGQPTRVGTGATVGGLYVIEVGIASHLAVS